MHSTLAGKRHVHPQLDWFGNGFVFCGVLVGACCRNAQPGSSTAWPVVLLPRGEGSGLSGGWRGFAIDQVRYAHEFCVMTHVGLISTMFLLFYLSRSQRFALLGAMLVRPTVLQNALIYMEHTCEG
jgi:hypothetical protein